MTRLSGAARVLLGVLITCVVCSCQQEASETPVELRVMSFNLRYGTANDGDNSWPLRRELLFRVIRDYGPDVLGSQEVLRFQLDELREALPPYGEVGVGRDDGKAAGEYAAILYRTDHLRLLDHGTYWLSDTPGDPGSASWGNTIPRICTWARFADTESGIAFYVYNLHLDHQSQPSRERSVELLTEHISSREHSDPFVVTGDFNAGESNAAMRYLRGEVARAHEESTEAPQSLGMRDSFRVLHPEQTEVGTFNGFDGITSGEKIDAVLMSGEWEVRQAEIIRAEEDLRYPSDHFPVVATLALNPTQQKTPTP